MTASEQSEETIFKQALKLQMHERHSFLQMVCGDNQKLLDRVTRLLQIEQQEPEFLESPPSAVAEAENSLGVVQESRIGPYRIREQIGEGGMGVVYLAEQNEPVRRKVALKVIKPGMDSKEIVARFNVERQALAVMEHPHIAKVFDAGVTPRGRSFFAMELVRGVSITEYCDQSRSSLKERLGLFIDVCEAVQHAHQKSIIHRDLKPSNILVTLIDAHPVVKVIDFGLAKATGGEPLTDGTIYTGFMKLMGTPSYMSPEQVGLCGQDVDTRSDVYSLGVVLYELLTGTTPLDRDSIRNQPYDEICRRIRESEAPSPSARISTIQDQQRTTIAHSRCILPQQLASELKGDLDRVVLKALAKDRSDRYQTAASFAADLRRYLRDEPVAAVAPSVLYVAGKAIRRHRLAIGTACAFALLLVLATILSTLFAVQSRQEASKARRETGRANQALAAEFEAREQITVERDRAERLRVQAERERENALAQAYVNDIRSSYLNARHADGNEQAHFELLRWVPVANEIDRRGWEWYLLNSIRYDAERFLHGHLVAVRGITGSPDGKQLVSLDVDGMLVRWNVETERKIDSRHAMNGMGTAVAWSSSGKHLATGDSNGVVRLWQVELTGRIHGPIHDWDQHTQRVNSLAFSPAGDQLASAASDATAIVWDVVSGKRVCTLETHRGSVNSVNWHPDGNQLLTASAEDHTVRCWEPGAARETAAPIEGVPVTWAVWHPQGDYLATIEGGSGHFTIRDAATHKPIQNRASPRAFIAGWNKDGTKLAVGGQTVRLWDDLADQPTREFRGHTFKLGSMVWLDSNRIATASSDHTVRVWNTRHQHVHSFDRHAAVRKARWSPDSTYLASLAAGKVQIAAATGTDNVCEIGADKPIEGFAWAPDSHRLATWDLDQVTIWDVHSAKAVMAFETGLHATNWTGSRSVEWNPTDSRLMTAVHDKLTIWDTTRGVKLQEFDQLEGIARWSPDGQRICVLSGSRTTAIMELQGGEVQKRTLQVTGPSSWSPDGCQLLTSEGNGAIRDAATGQLIIALQGLGREQITAVAWHPDARRVVTGDVSGTIRVWEARSGQELLVFREHAEPIAYVHFDRDGLRLVSADVGGKINVWDATAGYDRALSAPKTATLIHKAESHSLSVDERIRRARMASATGNWESAEKDFQQVAEQLGESAPKWFETGQWIMGPFPGDLAQPYAPEQQDFDPRQPLLGGASPALTRHLGWQLAEPSLEQGVSLSMHVGPREEISAYAVTKVYAPRQANVCVLMGASRFDAHRLWHNGTLIYEDGAQSTVAGRWPDEGCIAVSLVPGWNTFLTKIVNIPFREKDFFLYFRISDDPVHLARAYESALDVTDALVAVHGFLTEFDHDPYLYLARGVLHARQENALAAQEDFRRAERDVGPGGVASHLSNLVQYVDGYDGRKWVEVLTEALRANPKNMDLRAVLSRRLASLARCEEALAHERELAQVAAYADRTEIFALLLAACEQLPEYHQVRRRLLDRIRKNEPDVDIGVGGAHQIVACLVVPPTPEEMEQIERLYQWYPVQPVYGLADPHVRWRKFIEGLLALRKTEYDQAIELLAESAKYDRTLSEPWMVDSARQRAIASSAYLAIAQFHSGRYAEARASLRRAEQIREEASASTKRWAYVINATLALREAKRLVLP